MTSEEKREAESDQNRATSNSHGYERGEARKTTPSVHAYLIEGLAVLHDQGGHSLEDGHLAVLGIETIVVLQAVEA